MTIVHLAFPAAGKTSARKDLKRKRDTDDDKDSELMKRLDNLEAEKLGLVNKIEEIESEVNEVSL